MIQAGALGSAIFFGASADGPFDEPTMFSGGALLIAV